MRTIKLKLLNQQNIVSIVTNVRTFSEFQQLQEVIDLNIDYTNSKFIDRATKTTLELDGSVLPSIDCILMQYPSKTKSAGNWSEASYKDVVTTIKDLKDSGVTIPFNYTNTKKEVMAKFLDEHFATVESDEDNWDNDSFDEDELDTPSIEATVTLNSSQVASVMAQAGVTPPPVVNYVISLTEEEFAAEYNAISKELK